MSRAPDAFDHLLAGNRSYSSRIHSTNPSLLTSLSAGQQPEVLWIGCADSRVPETTVCDSQPGEIFVHRNIANVLEASDVNAQSVIAYAVGALKVKRIVVCGHTKCGGATAALGDADLGDALNAWLAPVRELRRQNVRELDALRSTEEKANRLAEINVLKSIDTLMRNRTVNEAMKERGLLVHGVIYDIPAAQLRVLEEVNLPAALEEEHRMGNR